MNEDDLSPEYLRFLLWWNSLPVSIHVEKERAVIKSVAYSAWKAGQEEASRSERDSWSGSNGS